MENKYNYKMVPDGMEAASLAIVKYNGEVFAQVPMQFAMPCKEYIIIMAAIDKVFNEFNDEMKTAFEGELLGGLISAMRGQINEEQCDEFVHKSGIMNSFTVDYSFIV